MKVLLIWILSSILLITLASSFYKSDCSSIRNGRFFQYKNVSQFYSTIIRKDSIQTEVNVQTGDTSYWKVRWTDDCIYTTQYLSGLKFESEEELNFYKQSPVIFKIRALTKNYYVYDAEVNYHSKLFTFSDTLWLQKR